LNQVQDGLCYLKPKSLLSGMLGKGLEPSRPKWARDFKSLSYQ